MTLLAKPHRLLAVVGLVTLAVLLVFAAPATVFADCAMPPPLKEAVSSGEVVFVGTVSATSNLNRWADVQVEEVWRGPDQPANVVVRGGMGDANAMSSVDRTFQAGARYLFVPYPDESGGLADNACTSTTEWGDDMAELRPVDVRAPIGGAPAEAGFDVGGLLAPLAVALIVGLALFGVGLVARGRESA